MHAPKSITIALVACVAMASSSSLRGNYGVGGRCFKDSYGFADYICPHGYENEHGKCQKYTKVFAPRECPHGFHFSHEWDKCAKEGHKECPAGYKWDGHKCALKVTKFVEKVCKGRKPKCHNEYKVCPHGFKSSGYKCVTEKVMYAAKKCPHGFFASYGKCVQERVKVCPYGYKY